MECRKCGFVNNQPGVTDRDTCPGCGAYYFKVNAAIESAEAEKKSEADLAVKQAEEKAARIAGRKERELFSGLVCRDCGAKSKRAAYKTPGSIGVEVLAWLAFIIPGIIYSVWRLSAKKRVCKHCGSERLVPGDSPVGREVIERYHRSD